MLPDWNTKIRRDVVEFDDWHPPGAYNGQRSLDIERLQVGYIVSSELGSRQVDVFMLTT